MNGFDILKLKQNFYAMKLRLKKPVVRNHNEIIQEYESFWAKARLYDNIVITGNEGDIQEFYDGNVYCKTPIIDFGRRRLNEFLKYVTNSCDFDESIIELGSGVGSNLFFLEDHGFKNLEGYELTTGGIKMAKQFASIKKSKVGFRQCNIITDDIDIKNKTVITFLSIEQLKLNLEFIIDKIIDHKPKKILSFESIFESWSEKMYARYMDYQTDYVKLLRSKKDIKLLELEKFNVNENLLRPIYFIKWELNI